MQRTDYLHFNTCPEVLIFLYNFPEVLSLHILPEIKYFDRVLESCQGFFKLIEVAQGYAKVVVSLGNPPRVGSMKLLQNSRQHEAPTK